MKPGDIIIKDGQEYLIAGRVDGLYQLIQLDTPIIYVTGEEMKRDYLEKNK